MHCYCALCKNPRKVFRKQGISLFNFFQAVGMAMIMSYAFWQRIDAKALPIFAVILMLLEVIIIFRSRLDVACPHCGFDPVLYSRDKEAASLKVKKYIEARQNDPDVWLARKPPLRFSKRKKNKSSTREIVV